MNPLARFLQLALDLAWALVSGILGAFGLAARRAVEPLVVERSTAEAVRPLRHEVLRAGRPAHTAVFDGDDAPATRHWVVRQADRVVGVGSVMQSSPPGQSEPRWQLRGMAVSPALRGAGVGRALLEAIQHEVDAPMWCNARTSAASFYARCGWGADGPVFEVDGIGPHQRMRWSPESPPDSARGATVAGGASSSGG